MSNSMDNDQSYGLREAGLYSSTNTHLGFESGFLQVQPMARPFNCVSLTHLKNVGVVNFSLFTSDLF